MARFLTYPIPEENPGCRCIGNPIAAMFCGMGHMLECHAPHNCADAGCSHLAKYLYTSEEFQKMQSQAREKLRGGQLPPYRLDELGNVVIDLNLVHLGVVADGPGRDDGVA